MLPVRFPSPGKKAEEPFALVPEWGSEDPITERTKKRREPDVNNRGRNLVCPKKKDILRSSLSS